MLHTWLVGTYHPDHNQMYTVRGRIRTPYLPLMQEIENNNETKQIENTVYPYKNTTGIL